VSATLDRIIEEVKALPPAERQQLRQLLDDEADNNERARRASLARAIRGKYRDVLTSSEEFAARKAQEIALEDRRR